MLPMIDNRQQMVLKKLKKNYKVISMENCKNGKNVCLAKVGDVLDSNVVSILSQFSMLINIVEK